MKKFLFLSFALLLAGCSSISPLRTPEETQPSTPPAVQETPPPVIEESEKDIIDLRLENAEKELDLVE